MKKLLIGVVIGLSIGWVASSVAGDNKPNPRLIEVNTTFHTPYSEVTLRDYFAAQVMVGIYASGRWGWGEDNYKVRRAAQAYAEADAMLAERVK